MGDLYKDDSGKTLRVNASFDMSSYTELSLVFTKPDNTVVTKTTTDGVAIGAGVTDPDLGVLAANQYVEYNLEVGLLDQAGRWCVRLIYDNTSASPVDKFHGAPAHFTVKELC
jgi:hypothetical protein